MYLKLFSNAFFYGIKLTRRIIPQAKRIRNDIIPTIFRWRLFKKSFIPISSLIHFVQGQVVHLEARATELSFGVID
jgi:hypothetical protein